MADIKQAARWMKEGHEVYDPLGFRIKDKNGEIVFVETEERFEMLTSEILSEEWELAS